MKYIVGEHYHVKLWEDGKVFSDTIVVVRHILPKAKLFVDDVFLVEDLTGGMDIGWTLDPTVGSNALSGVNIQHIPNDEVFKI